MKRAIIMGCLVLSMAVCTGCGAKKDTNDKKEAATEEVKREVLSKYKVPKIVGAKKTDQLADAQQGETIATMKVKKYGEIKLKFFLEKAPLAVKNFVTLADNGYFDGQKFHRVINDFMIQGGDPTGTGTGGESIWGETFENEISDQLLPLRGALCMANTGVDGTNGSQFFIVQAKPDTAKAVMDEGSIEFPKKQEELFLDQGGYPSLNGDYTVFGQMIDGYDVLDNIAAAKTKDNGTGEESQPEQDIIIEKITISNAK